MKVLINIGVDISFNTLTEAQISRIRSVSEELEIHMATNDQDLAIHLPDTEVILGQFTRQMFEQAEQLKLVMVESAGVDTLMFPELVESNLTLVSAKGTVGSHLADHSWALFLALLRGIPKAINAKSWDIRREIREEAWEPHGKTLGIIGLGGTGIECARRAQGFDMHVIAIDPEDIPKPVFVHQLWNTDRFYDLLERSNVVMNCTPLTPLTHGMFNDEAFKHMQTSSFLINVTRGPIVDDLALVRAINEGRLAGAGLDVTSVEPLPPQHPLWKMDNVIITPHASGGSPHRLDRWVNLVCENLRRYLDGRTLLSVIDKSKEY